MITKEFLESEYYNGKSGYAIAKELNLPRYEVDNAITKFGIKRRKIHEARKPIGSRANKNEKWCPGCVQDLPHDNFSKNSRGRLGLDAYCKECSSKKAKKYIKQRTISRQKLKAKLVLQFGNTCKHCRAYNLPIDAYVFHHHSESMREISYISPSTVITANNANIIATESLKWDMLCANCHSVHHGCKIPATEFAL